MAESTDYLDLRGLAQKSLGEVLFAAGRRDEARVAFGRALAEYEAKGATAHVSSVRARIAALDEVGTSI